MSPLPADLPLNVTEASAPFIGQYLALNRNLRSRGYLHFDFVDIDLPTDETRTAITDFRRDRTLEEESSEVLDDLTAAALNSRGCGQFVRATWMKLIDDDAPPEPIEEYTIPESHWDKTIFYYRVKTIPNGSNRGNIEAAVHSACEWWESVGLGFTFEKVDSEDDTSHVDIDISFYQSGTHIPPIDNVDFTVTTGEKFALAHAFYPVSIEGNRASDIHFNGDSNIEWVIVGGVFNGQDGADSFDLRTMAAHEIGHALGLRHNNNNPEAVMYPDYGHKKEELHSDDIDALSFHYDPGSRPVIFGKIITDPGTGGPNAG